MSKRLFDVFLSIVLIICFCPLFLIISLAIIIWDKSLCVIFKQVRTGRYGHPFTLYKFRSMRSNSEKEGLLTVGDNDSRITLIGHYLRKFKLDELPQLFNILIGNMSFVGPRPEVKKYTDLYDKNQMRILTLRPGLTDWASIHYSNESQMLQQVEDPENFYINTILPHKLVLGEQYLRDNNLLIDFKILFFTLLRLMKH